MILPLNIPIFSPEFSMQPPATLETVPVHQFSSFNACIEALYLGINIPSARRVRIKSHIKNYQVDKHQIQPQKLVYRGAIVLFAMPWLFCWSRPVRTKCENEAKPKPKHRPRLRFTIGEVNSSQIIWIHWPHP